MKIIYNSETIEQVFNLLDNLTISGVQNSQIVASLFTLLQQNEVANEVATENGSETKENTNDN